MNDGHISQLCHASTLKKVARFLEIAIKAYEDKKEIDVKEIREQLNETSLNPEEIENY